MAEFEAGPFSVTVSPYRGNWEIRSANGTTICSSCNKPRMEQIAELLNKDDGRSHWTIRIDWVDHRLFGRLRMMECRHMRLTDAEAADMEARANAEFGDDPGRTDRIVMSKWNPTPTWTLEEFNAWLAATKSQCTKNHPLPAMQPGVAKPHRRIEMADWKIDVNNAAEKQNRTEWGDAEYERRLAVANAKADELYGDGDDDSFAEATIMRPQFQRAAMAMKAATFEKAAKLSGRKWASVIYGIAEA